MNDYVYLEYPKWIRVGDAEPFIVDTSEDEKAAKGEAVDSLKVQAEKLGIEVDARWGDKRLQAEIDKAK